MPSLSLCSCTVGWSAIIRVRRERYDLNSPCALAQVYEGLSYKLSVAFSEKYPYEAPTVKFVTPCFHPNVDTAGNICLDILKDKWSAAFSVRTVLMSLQSLLGGALENHQLLATNRLQHLTLGFSSLCGRSEQRQPAERLRRTAVGQRRGYVIESFCTVAALLRCLCALCQLMTGAEYKATLHKKYTEASEAPAPEPKA